MRWIALVGCVIGLVGCGPTEEAPDIDLLLQPSGPPTKLSSLQGKVVILDFWATWCGPCKMSMPAVEKIYKKYQNKGLVVVGISEDLPESQDQIPAVKKQLGVTYPTDLATRIPDLGVKFPHEGIPALFIIDKQGNIAKKQEGILPADADSGEMPDIDAEVATLLKK